ncbi:MAG: choice-of-anchor D domain-containing protein [Candidatus Kapabacteria bacterium]|nr:choice-of-anchor D domain-containing protein [Candidatus Kapabacteria bacterium]
MNTRQFPKKIASLIIFLITTSFTFYSCKDNSTEPTEEKIKVYISTDLLDFGIVQLGLSKIQSFAIENTSKTAGTLTLKITGEDNSAFTIMGNNQTLTLKPGQKDTIFIQFTPIAEKTYNATLEIGTDPVTKLSLRGIGKKTVEINYLPTFIDFGKVVIGESLKQKVSINNSGTTPYILSPSIVGKDVTAFFIEYSPEKPIPPGASDSVIIRFQPKEEKISEAVFYLDSEQKYPVGLKGEGIKLEHLEVQPKSLDFGNIEINSEKTLEITVVNNLSQSFTINSNFPSGSEGFSVTNSMPLQLAGKNSTKINVKFKPTEIKLYETTLFLDNDKKYSVALKGTGVAANDLEVNPKSLDFGNVELNSTSSQEITITNKTTKSLKITCTFNSGGTDFSVSSQNPFDLAAGSNSKITVKFSPKEIRAYGDVLRISTDNNTTYSVNLKGAGISPELLSLVCEVTSAPPVIDGNDYDECWKSAKELFFVMHQIEPTYIDQNKKFNGSIKALRDDEYIYFLVKIKDDSRNDMPNYFIFNGGDPSKESSWTLTTEGQDGISFMFPITSNVRGKTADDTFDKVGCYVACHTTNSINNFEGGSFPDFGTIDIWYWKAGTTGPQGYADDYYAMGQDGKYPKERRGDVGGRTFEDPNFRPSGTGLNLPISVPGGDNYKLDPSRFIWDDTSDPFDPNSNNPITKLPWAAGDRLAGWKLRVQDNEFSGRGDVEAKGIFWNGQWVVEFKRKLKTESTNGDDMEFKKGSIIAFSLGYFDNTRKYAEFEYINLKQNPRPGHYGTNPPVIIMQIK